MIVLSAILFTVGCLLILCFVLLFHACQKRLALVASDVREEVARKTRAAQEVDSKLTQRVHDGRPLSESIRAWQRERAAILEAGRASDPWRWSVDDLRQWMREQTRGQCEAIRRKYLVATVCTAVCALLISGTVCLIYYQYYSARGAEPGVASAAPALDGDQAYRGPSVGSSTGAATAGPPPLAPPNDLSGLLPPAP